MKIGEAVPKLGRCIGIPGFFTQISEPGPGVTKSKFFSVGSKNALFFKSSKGSFQQSDLNTPPLGLKS